MALHWWRQMAFKVMSLAARRGRRARQRRAGYLRPLRGPLSVERLESRVLFDVTPMLTTGGVTFTGGQNDNFYLKTVDGVLQWSTDGTTYSSNLAPTGSSPQTLTLSSDTTVNVNVGGTLHLESMTGAAGTFESTSALVVDPGVILSSQVFDSNGNVIANAQGLSLLAPVITLDVGAQIQAGTSGIFKGGQINLLASDTETSATAQGNAQVNITSASVTGSDIFIEATSSLNASAALPLDVPGASVAVIDGGSQALVSIAGTTQITGTGNVKLSATSDVHTTATARASSTGGSAAVDGAFASSTVASSALTEVADTAFLSAGGVLAVSATDDTSVTTTADGSDSGSNAAGASLAVADVTGDTRASLDSGASASASEIDILAIVNKDIVTTATSTTAGATQNSHDIQALSQNNAKTNDGKVQVAGALAVTSLQGTTDAHVASTGLVKGTEVINIDAISSNTTQAATDGSATGSAATGVGVAVAVDLATVNNQASIGGNANLQAPAINVEATTPEATPNVFTAQAISGVGNTSKVGVAGALAVNVVNNRNTASIQPGATVAVGGADLNLVTNNEATESATAKPSGLGASGGSVGVGAAVALNIATNTTEAVVGDNAVLSNACSLSLNATSLDTVTTLADAGATGGTALSPVVAIAVTNNTTTAQLGSGSPLGITGSLSVSATHGGTTTATVDASANGDSVAVGAALALALANDTTTSTTDSFLRRRITRLSRPRLHRSPREARWAWVPPWPSMSSSHPAEQTPPRPKCKTALL